MTQREKATRLSPDEAFATLGNEIRVGILRALGDADEPLAFSELYDRLDVSDSAQFNYHLDKLLGHFVRKLDTGYALARPGRRVVEAILSGAVTDDPALGRTAVEDRCVTCERALEVQWEGGSIEILCPGCERRWEQSWGRVGGPQEAPEGYLGRLPFPPAGLNNRSPSEILRAAFLWTNLELLAVANELCPRCAATVEPELHVCADHDDADGPCPACGTRYAARLSASCTNCIYSVGCAAAWGTLPSPELLTFLFEHGLNPVAPVSAHRLDWVLNEYDETVHSRDPFRATFEFVVDGDSLRLDVDEDLNVVAATR
jgi:hypothetical protein